MKEKLMRLLKMAAAAVVSTVSWGTPSLAWEVGTMEPTQHHDALLAELLAADQTAYAAAALAYTALAEAKAAYTTAEEALNTATDTGIAGTSPAENLGGLAQNKINTRVAKEAARAAYDAAMIDLASARAEYEVVRGQSLDEKLQVVEDDLQKASDYAAEQAAKVAELQIELLTLKQAVCLGHAYDHDHRADYDPVCTENQPATAAGSPPVTD